MRIVKIIDSMLQRTRDNIQGLISLVILLVPCSLYAQRISPAAVQIGPPLTRGAFNVETTSGAVLGSSRVTGMGGAFVAIAEEAVGVQFNPAAAAQTPYYSNNWFEWFADWAFLSPGLLQGKDFDFGNSGIETDSSFLAYFLAGGLQFGEFGVAAYFSGQFANTNRSSSAATPLRTDGGNGALSFGYGFWDHQIIVGAGVKVGYLRLQEEGALISDWNALSFGGDFGAIYRPKRLPVRFGASVRTPLVDVIVDDCDRTTTCAGNFITPSGLAGPWSARVGAAWYISFDGQPFNTVPYYYDRSNRADHLREMEESGELAGTYRGGRYLLLSVDVEVIGESNNVVGLAGLNTQTRIVAGEHVSVSGHFGIESEIIRRRLRLRAGTYYEPSRYAQSAGRIHGTFGWIVRMFDFNMPGFGPRGISFQGFVDIADRYSNIGGTLMSFWH